MAVKGRQVQCDHAMIVYERLGPGRGIARKQYWTRVVGEVYGGDVEDVIDDAEIDCRVEVGYVVDLCLS